MRKRRKERRLKMNKYTYNIVDKEERITRGDVACGG
jgi:hypothetical protein